MLVSVIAAGVVLAAWSLVARRLERWRVTALMVLILAGAVVGLVTHDALAETLNTDTAQPFVEIILAVLLFIDATDVRGGLFGRDPRSALRVLLIALPLSLGLSVALGLWLLPGVPWSVLPLLAYVLSVAIHGNGFVSAFVCGIAYSGLRRSEHVRRDLGLIDDVGFLLTVVMWFAFGALTVVALRNAVPWGIVVFCLLALTLVRMLAVLAAMLGSHFTWPERLLPGWSGPRRTTSIGFGALAFNASPTRPIGRLVDHGDRRPGERCAARCRRARHCQGVRPFTT